jgi:hypothetical protein
MIIESNHGVAIRLSRRCIDVIAAAQYVIYASNQAYTTRPKEPILVHPGLRTYRAKLHTETCIVNASIPRQYRYDGVGLHVLIVRYVTSTT